MSLAENLKQFRKAKGLSLADIAEIATVSKDYVCKLEGGDGDYQSLEKLYKVAVALDTTIADLLDLPIRVKRQ